MNFWGRMFWIGMWVKVVFMRYMAAWLIAEGGCIMIGESVTSLRPSVTSLLPSEVSRSREARAEGGGLLVG